MQILHTFFVVKSIVILSAALPVDTPRDGLFAQQRAGDRSIENHLRR